MNLSVKIYKEILEEDATNIEAIACIGMHHFYSEQPEVALRFYRWSLIIDYWNSFQKIFQIICVCLPDREKFYLDKKKKWNEFKLNHINICIKEKFYLNFKSTLHWCKWNHLQKSWHGCQDINFLPTYSDKLKDFASKRDLSGK